MGHAAGQPNQYHLPEDPDSHEPISCKRDVTRMSSTKRTVADQEGSQKTSESSDEEEAGLQKIDEDLHGDPRRICPDASYCEVCHFHHGAKTDPCAWG